MRHLTPKQEVKTPRGTIVIHTIFNSLAEAREHGWGFWFQYGSWLILGKDNRVGAAVIAD